MRCHKCGTEAVINMRRHKLALCESCFPHWVQDQVAQTIRRHKMFDEGSRILLAVSGGKDSLALWDILLTLGYRVDALYIELGIEDNQYSEQSQEKARAFASMRPSSTLLVESIPQRYGASVPEVAQRLGRLKKVCSVCGLVKRHTMNRIATEGQYEVIATGHNLDDEAAVLLGNTLHWQSGYLQRQAPVLPEDEAGLARKVKPLCFLYEREMAAYALVQGIDYIYDECPYSVRARSIFYKDLLTELETRSPGSKRQFYGHFLQAKNEGRVQFSELTRPNLHPCPQCGQPTSAPHLCAFCRLWQDTGSDL